MSRLSVTPLILSFLLILSAASCTTAQVSETPQPVETPLPSVSPAAEAPALEGFRRGVNLGNMLEAPTEGEWGQRFKDEYAGLIKDAGFDFVRLPVRWSAHISGAYHTIDPAFLSRVDHIVDTLLNSGLGIIINIHHFSEMNEDPESNADALYRIWDQLAAHYKGLPSNVIFEVFNEPNGALDTRAWNRYQNRCIETIRRFDPERTILVTAAEWGGPGGIPRLNLPDDPHLAVSFHYYDPFPFTHQGAEWVENADAYMGTLWEGSDKEKNDIDNAFRRVSQWSAEHGVPVVLGEFGAYSKADMDARALWTAHMRQTAESYGFAWCYWEFCSGFGVYDPYAGEYVSPLLEALIP